MAVERATLAVWDYVIFCVMLAIFAAIGFYHAYQDRRIKDVKNFHVSMRRMHPIPVAMSLSVTILSSITLIGLSSEIYTFGTMHLWMIVGFIVAMAGNTHVFLPAIYKTDKISCYEYLQLRFGHVIRTIASVIYILQSVVLFSLLTFAPSLAFEVLTGLPLWATMLGISFVVTLYTSLGGMKSVIWADCLQMIIMFAGLIVLLAKTTHVVGGISRVWEIADAHHRIEFLTFDLDPHTRHTVWSVMIGQMVIFNFAYGVNQAATQRACSTPTLKQAQLAMWFCVPVVVLIMVLVGLIGLSMFAYYSECDPATNNLINRNDQLLPLLIIDILADTPGLAGLFVAAMMSASLSSLSSGLSGMAAVVVEDFVKPSRCCKISENTELILSRLFVVIFGCMMLGGAHVVSQLGGLILQLLTSIVSMTSGPLVGLFVCGVVFPWTNRHGATIGLLGGVVLTGWLSIGTLIVKPSGTATPLPVSIDGCLDQSPFNSTIPPTSLWTTTPAASPDDEPLLYNFYRISYQWYSGFGMMTTIILALIVSFLTGYTKPKDIDSDLMCPLFYRLCFFLPERLRKYLKFGVDYTKAVEDPKLQMYTISKGKA